MENLPNRIILIDDEHELTELAGSYLKLNGFQVETHNDPLEALASLGKGPCGAILVDLMMFPMDGLSVVRKLREMTVHVSTPVFVLSAKTLSDQERKDLLLLGVHLLKKPFHPRRLVEAIRAQLKPS